MTKHIIIVSYDGIVTHYCGVGTIIRNTMKALDQISQVEKIRVSLVHIFADPKGKVFNKECYLDSLNLINKTGGSLISLSNGTPGFDAGDMWKSFPEWEKANTNLSSALDNLLTNNEDNIVMLHDTPFLLFSKFKDCIINRKVKYFYLPHSSGLNHAFGNAEWRSKRVKIEKECFSLITKDYDSVIIATGKSFGEHLINDYGLSFKPNAYLKNGLYFDQYSDCFSIKYKNKDLKKYGIDVPDNSKVIFSWGRCSIAKGFKELVLAWSLVEKELPNHYLVLQVPNNSGENEYFQNLKESRATIPRIILIDDFNSEIWKRVLRCENTDVVCLPSLMDPNPHTPIEAKLFSRGMNYVIVASEKDGVKDTFLPGEAILVDPYNTESFARSLLMGAELDVNVRNKMAISNSITINNYDYVENFKSFISNLP
jgi:hypothetical protein